MDKARQMNLMLGAAKDYQNGLISLGTLIEKIVGLLSILEDQALNDQLLNACLALEQIYADTCLGDFESEKNGRSVIERAVNEIIEKIGSQATHQS
jgi:hypothetical protein